MDSIFLVLLAGITDAICDDVTVNQVHLCGQRILARLPDLVLYFIWDLRPQTLPNSGLSESTSDGPACRRLLSSCKNFYPDLTVNTHPG